MKGTAHQIIDSNNQSEIRAARKEDVLKDVKHYVTEANRHNVHKLLGLRDELRLSDLQKVRNYRTLVMGQLRVQSQETDSKADDHELSGAEYHVDTLLGSLEQLDRIEDEGAEEEAA